VTAAEPELHLQIRSLQQIIAFLLY